MTKAASSDHSLPWCETLLHKYSRLAALRFVWASLLTHRTETEAHCGRVSLFPVPERTQETPDEQTGSRVLASRVVAQTHLDFILISSLGLRQQLLQLHQGVLQCVHLVHQVVLLIVQLCVGHHGLTILLLHLSECVLISPTEKSR